MTITTKSELMEARATIIACAQTLEINMGSLDEVREIWQGYFEEDEGASPVEAAKLVQSSIDAFVRGLGRGETYDPWLTKADKYLVAWGEISKEDLAKLSDGRKGSRKPKADTEEDTTVVPFGVKPGDRVKISGRSWDGYIATVVKIEDGWVHVTTPMPSGKLYEGRTRPSKIVEIVE